MLRIGISGLPGTGKSCLARGLSTAFIGVNGFENVEYTAEYARHYIAKYGPPKEIYEQFRIIRKQQEWEDVLPEEISLMITDCPLPMNLAYVLDMRDRKEDVSLKDQMMISDIVSMLSKANYPTRYDFMFHLPPVVSPKKDGVRIDLHFEEEWRQTMEGHFSTSFDMFPSKRLEVVVPLNHEDRVLFCRDIVLGKEPIEIIS